MRYLLSILPLVLSLSAIAQDGAAVAAPEPDSKAAARLARSTAHEIGAAGSYSQRAALWERSLVAKGVALVPVQLFAGNEYQIIVGFDAPGASIGLSVFDARGSLVPAGVDRGDGKMVLAIKPKRSGVHIVRMRLTHPESPPATAVLTYVYK